MNYRIYGPYEIPRLGGELKGRIEKENIDEFWSSVDPGLKNACGIYIFSIKTSKRENPGMLGRQKIKATIKSVLHPIRLSTIMMP